MRFASRSVAILATEDLASQGGELLFVLLGAALALLLCGAMDLMGRWRTRHPRRRPPSSRDWARIRAAERRSQAARPWTADVSALTPEMLRTTQARLASLAVAG